MPHILTVDDSASMRQMVAFTLRDAGFEVSEAEDGSEALSIAENNSFDLVLADVNMPKMDGISLIRKLRTLSNYQYTPLADADHGVLDGAQERGQGSGRHGLDCEALRARQPRGDHSPRVGLIGTTGGY